MKEIHQYLSILGFDLTTPGPNHFAGFLTTASGIEVKTLFLKEYTEELQNALIMDVFESETSHSAVIARQEIATRQMLRQHMLNSYTLREQCPALYQKVLETPV